MRLHEIMLESTGNSLLRSLLALVGDHSLRIRSVVEAILRTTFPQIIVVITNEHLEILEALNDADPVRASEAVTKHLRNAEKRTLCVLREGGEINEDVALAAANREAGTMDVGSKGS